MNFIFGCQILEFLIKITLLFNNKIDAENCQDAYNLARFEQKCTKSTYGTLPVKFNPAKCGEAVIVSPKTGPSAGTKLTTPAGTPASLHILKICQFDRRAVSLGFHSTALP